MSVLPARGLMGEKPVLEVGGVLDDAAVDSQDAPKIFSAVFTTPTLQPFAVHYSGTPAALYNVAVEATTAL